MSYFHMSTPVKEPSRVFDIRLPERLAQQVEEVARDQKTDLSDLVQWAIRVYLRAISRTEEDLNQPIDSSNPESISLDKIRELIHGSRVSTLLVGFDSAWTAHNCGGIVAALQLADGSFSCIGNPCVADFQTAQSLILDWQAEYQPTETIVLLDQPTIVKNASGQRLVENIVGSSVGSRYGGMQPANTGKESMFGAEAPIWSFLSRFGEAADPHGPFERTRVFETYPVLTMIALGWTLPDTRTCGRLPKYNPKKKKKTFTADCNMSATN